jgi:hypothetical protein
LIQAIASGVRAVDDHDDAAMALRQYHITYGVGGTISEMRAWPWPGRLSTNWDPASQRSWGMPMRLPRDGWGRRFSSRRTPWQHDGQAGFNCNHNRTR